MSRSEGPLGVNKAEFVIPGVSRSGSCLYTLCVLLFIGDRRNSINTQPRMSGTKHDAH